MRPVAAATDAGAGLVWTQLHAGRLARHRHGVADPGHAGRVPGRHPAHRRRQPGAGAGAASRAEPDPADLRHRQRRGGGDRRLHLGDEHLRHDHGAAIRCGLPTGRGHVRPGRARLLARRPGAARLAPGLRRRWPDRVRRARVRGRMGHPAVAAAEWCRPGDPGCGRGRESASPASRWASSWACSWASSSSWSAAAACRRSATRPRAATASATSSAPRGTATACARAATPSSSWSSAASCSSARPGGSMPASGGGRWTRRRPLCAPSCSTSAGSAASTARAGTISARSSSSPTSTHSTSS